MTLYIGYTYFFDGERFRAQTLTCMSENFQDVLFYMQNVRGFLIANTHNPDNSMLDEIMAQANVRNSVVPIGEIVKCSFESDMAMTSYVNYGTRERFMMVPHSGDIDAMLAADMKKKDNRHDIMVPSIVEDIITQENETFAAELGVTSHTLKKLALFINRRNDLIGLKKSVINTIEKIEAIQKDELSISDGITSRHPILFCPEEEYRTMIKKQLEWEALRAEYHQIINED